MGTLYFQAPVGSSADRPEVVATRPPAGEPGGLAASPSRISVGISPLAIGTEKREAAMAKPVLRTSLCDFLGIEYPILLAGMGGTGRATPPPLVAAVSNSGGLGVMGATGLSLDQIRKNIREIRSLTTRPFGVDLLLPASLVETEDTRSSVRQQLHKEYPRHVEFVDSLRREYGLPEVYLEDEPVISPKYIEGAVHVILEENVPVFAAALGDPSWVVPLARERGIVVMGLAGTVRNAIRHVQSRRGHYRGPGDTRPEDTPDGSPTFP